MFCPYCGEKIIGKPVKQSGEYFCSLECANRASGFESEEADEYYEECPVEDIFEDDE